MNLKRLTYRYYSVMNSIKYICENNISNININLLKFVYTMKYQKPALIKSSKEYIYTKTYNNIIKYIIDKKGFNAVNIGIYTVESCLKKAILEILLNRKTMDLKKLCKYKNPIKVMNYTRLLAKFVNQFVFEKDMIQKKVFTGDINLKNMLNISNN